MESKVKIEFDNTAFVTACKNTSESFINFQKAVEKSKSADNKSRFEKAFDKVSTFLWGEKSFKWGELKGL